jgi:two-component system chemotaxis response regulator CheB
MTARVLIVDDSTVARRLLTEVLAGDPTIEVVGTASDADSALAKIAQLTPDVVTLDVDLPGRNGLDLLVDIRKASPRLPVIMVSASTQQAATTTLDALARGASDYVTKPSGLPRDQALAHIRDQLVPRVRALTGSAGPRTVARRGTPSPRLELLAIGASTGGPNALDQLFRGLPADLAVPVVVVQHMPPTFTRLLAERLDGRGPLRFAEAVDGEPLRPGRVLLAPGDHHLRVVRRRDGLAVALDRGPPEHSCRPAVDVMLRSIAEAGLAALAVILTGMGQDGLLGCQAIHDRGGQVLAQDEATSVVWGMPGFVARAGLAARVLPLVDLAPEILSRVGAAPPLVRGCHGA